MQRPCRSGFSRDRKPDGRPIAGSRLKPLLQPLEVRPDKATLGEPVVLGEPPARLNRGRI
ncbi:hypothetical protein SAMN02745674_02414 [Lysobacter spongiicola DSM 21749]|uniref:Uncharacterized protein n=1 Tax=Lysobacter spongiicola DSM 21749 TaxID=1122188 RepID=A0A1T4RWI7_9GAMM|nr:hypothetical protein SAMN02745674_02414 [Lysobacter spongiicola DSM 21749]